jgi:KUP system potassium uptake protein
VEGTAVYPHPTKDTTPLALRATVEHHKVLHERVVVVSARAANVPRVRGRERLTVDDLGYGDDGIYHVTVRYGFSERPDLPRALHEARRRKRLPVDFDPDRTSYFLSRATIRKADTPTMARWRRALFVVLAHNAANPADYFGLPLERTVVMGTHVDI